jgi:hypothetical protein
MKSHTGGVMSFGIGGLACKSSKQKLNTKSSTEAEVVGASDYLPNTMWMQMFMEEQGHKTTESILEQDNESAMKLEKNGRMSAGQKSRHINIRYFWIKDRTQANGITIRHCPTIEMLADFFTKPLQGNLFRRFSDVILGYSHVDTLKRDPTVPPEERVGKDQAQTRGIALSGHAPVNENTVNGNESTAKKATWADIVRGREVGKKVEEPTSNKNVSSALSRNNPVSRTEV